MARIEIFTGNGLATNISKGSAQGAAKIAYFKLFGLLLGGVAATHNRWWDLLWLSLAQETAFRKY